MKAETTTFRRMLKQALSLRPGLRHLVLANTSGTDKRGVASLAIFAADIFAVILNYFHS